MTETKEKEGKGDGANTTTSHPRTTTYTLYNVVDRLSTRGWQVPAYSMPANRQHLVVQRILVRHGMRMDLCSFADLKRSIEYFELHPVRVPLTEDEAGGFAH